MLNFSALLFRILPLAAIVAPMLASATEPKWNATVEPAVMDGKNSTGSTVGLNYNFAGTLYESLLSTNDAGGKELDPVGLGPVAKLKPARIFLIG